MKSSLDFESLLYAVYCLGPALLSRAWFPTTPRQAHFQTFLFLALSLVFLAKGFRLNPWPTRRRLHGCIRAPLLAIPCILFALLIFQMTAFTFFVSYLLFSGAMKLLVLLEAVWFLALRPFVKRRDAWRVKVRIASRTILFINCMLFIPLCAWMWRQPSDSECNGAIQPGIVGRLTPASYPKNKSYPYNVIYIPDKKLVLASFKMAGNLVLTFWNDERQNRLVAIDVSDKTRPRLGTLPMPGPLMPETFEYNPARKEVLVTRVGYDKKTIDIIGLNDFPNLRRLRGRAVNFEPNGVAMMPNNREFVAVSINLDIIGMDYDSLREFYRTEAYQPPKPVKCPIAALNPNHPMVQFLNNCNKTLQIFNNGLSLLGIWHTPGSSLMYMSFLGTKVGEYDMNARKSHLAKVGFGGGDLIAVPESQTLYQADFLFRSLNVVDTKSMTLKKRIRLGYTPRAVQADFRRGIVMVGDWFRGTVNLYRASTFERIGAPIPVGSYLRDFDYDAERGLLFSTSKCGVYQTDIDKIIKRAKP